ncbi:MAG: hypothetical protein HUJ98_12715 [Bacteroidaceae bacterium]|nr:hypothetical protein [Bacteroidaceae bacterium]
MKKIIIIAIILTACFSCERNINSLPSKVLTYNELPTEMQQYLLESPDLAGGWEMILFVDENEKATYRLQPVKTIIGPWITGEKLINVKNKKEFKINQGTPAPYILYKDRLYIPHEFINFGEDFKSFEFSEYELK